MKTLLVALGGTLTVGDLLIIEYSHPVRGGNSAIKATVRPPKDEIVTDPVTGAKSVRTSGETLASLARQFVDDVNAMKSWASDEFRASLRDGGNGASFVIKCTDAVSDVVFKSYVEGAGTETIEIEVL
jgi:hypothetical protein